MMSEAGSRGEPMAVEIKFPPRKGKIMNENFKQDPNAQETDLDVLGILRKMQQQQPLALLKSTAPIALLENATTTSILKTIGL